MKKNIFVKNKKILFAVLPLFIIIYFVYLALFQLNVLVSIGVRLFTHGTMKIEEVIIEKGSSLKEGKIQIINSKLYENKELIADTPKMVIDYKNWKIDKIDIYNPDVMFVRKNSDVNFVTVFVGSDNGKAKSKNEKKKANEKDPILKRINVYDAKLNYVDISYSSKISQQIENVNGYVAFEKGYKTDLKFTGNNKDENYSYSFNNTEKSYDMKIELSNIDANDELVQYGYDSEGDIGSVKGKMNLDLRINDDGFFGKGKLSQGELIYKDLGVPVEDVNLDLDFLGKRIVIDGNYLFFGKNGKFSVEYNEGQGVDVGFKLKNVLYNEAAQYQLLKDTGIQIDDFNLDELNITLSAKNSFKAQVEFKSTSGFKKEIFALNDISGKLIYEKGELRINDFHTSVKLDREGRTVEREVTGSLRYKGDTGRVKINAKSNNDGFLSNVDLSFLFSAGKENLKFKLDSDIIDLNGRYEYKENALYLNQKKNFDFKYDIKNKNIDELKGYLISKLDSYSVRTDLKLEDNNAVNISSKIRDEKDEIRGSIDGTADIKNGAYDFKVNGKNIHLSDQTGGFAGNIDGYVKGEKGNLEGEFLFENFSVNQVKNNIKISDILGVATIKKDTDISVVFQGEIGKVKYDDYEINGFKVSAKYSTDTLEILNASNKFLTLSGKYSIINSNIDLSVVGKNLNKDAVKIADINYNIESVNGNISGKLDSLKGKITIKNGAVDFGQDRFVRFNGDIDYMQNKISAENFMINENKINFNYYLDKKIGNYEANIFEPLLSEFIQGIKFRVIGETHGTIKEGKIFGEFKGSVNEFYYKGTKIPNLIFDGNYDNETINFKNLDILSFDDGNIVINSEGNINIKDKTIDFIIPEQAVPVDEILKRKDLSGTISINGKAKGTFEDIEYNLNAQNGKIIYKDTVVDKIGFNISGNREKAELSKFTASYLSNSLSAEGLYNITENSYNFDVKSSVIDLKFLSMFLEPYGFEDISGNGKINLNFTDKVPEGEIVLYNFKLSSKKYGLDLNNLNGDFEFDKDNVLRIKKFTGNLNNGSVNILGYVDAEKVISNFLGESFGKIDYNLTLEGRNIDYSYEDYFRMNFNTRLSFRNNAVFGTITVNEGKIQKILKEDFGITTIIKNFIRNFINRNRAEKIFIENTQNFSGMRNAASDVRINVGFNIDKGIEIDVDKITNFFTNVRGTILGQGRLVGNLGKLNFLGENSIKDGRFVLNGNQFNVDRAIILFNDRESYIPDLNPNITFSTNSIINNKNFEVSLDGPVRNMIFTIRSGNDVSVNSLDSVLDGEAINGNGNNNLSILLTNIIGGQISDIVINPIVNVLRTVGFSNLRVRSSIVAEDRRRDSEEESSMMFGAYIEAESPIYKDKLFWKVKANFINDEDRNSTENSYNYGVADYDINIYNRLNNNISWGVGAQKLREDLERKSNDMNYYIELKFEKKFDF